MPKGVPIKPTFRSVLIRTVIATLFFGVILATMGQPVGAVAISSVIMFVILLGFGWFFDNMLHRYRVRRWMQKNGFDPTGRG